MSSPVVARRLGWPLLCCTVEFSVVDPSARWLSECCQSLLLDILISAVVMIWLAFRLDRTITYTRSDEENAIVSRSCSMRTCASFAGVACVCSVVRCVVYALLTEGCKSVAGFAAPVCTALAWLLLTLFVLSERRQSAGVGRVAACLTLLALCRLVGDLVRAAGQLRSYELVTSGLQLVAALLVNFSSWYRREQRLRQLTVVGSLGEAEKGSWACSITFGWVDALMHRGVQRYLAEVDDLFHLPGYLRIETVCARFSSAVTSLTTSESVSSSLVSDSEPLLSPPLVSDPEPLMLPPSVSAPEPLLPPPSVSDREPFLSPPPAVTAREPLQSAAAHVRPELPLLRALFRSYGGEYVCLGVLKLIADVATFAGPLVLGVLLLALEDGSGEAVSRGLLYVALIFLSNAVTAVTVTQYDYRVDKLALKVRAAFTGVIYRKVLRVPLAGLGEMSSGQVVTLLGVDVDRVTSICNSFHALWSLPLQFVLALWLLYAQVGVACFVGLVFAVCLVPLNKYIANKVSEFSTGLLKHKDLRVKLVSQVLRGIYTVKLCCLEAMFCERIDMLRRDELIYLRKQKYMDAWCVFFWSMTPAFITVLTFGTYVLLGHKLEPANVFTTIALMRLLNNPINAFPWVLNGMVDAFVSLKRIRQFLTISELDRRIYFAIDSDSTPADNTSVLVGCGRFSWHCDETPACLHRFDMSCCPGQLTVVTGALGSGKSSLIYALSGELFKLSGSVFVAGSDGSLQPRGLGLVTQRPWLRSGSVRENILAGAALEPHWYECVLEACCLSGSDRPSDDCSSGCLSGGQRMRVALARAVYRRCAVYLLDDVLAPLDPCVARHILRHCIRGILREHTVIVCGDNAELLALADQVVTVSDGCVQIEQREDDTTHLTTPADSHLQYTAAPSIEPDTRLVLAEREEETERRCEEESVRGTIGCSVLAMYYRCLGTGLVPAILITVTLMQTVRNGSDLWLGVFVSRNVTSTSLSPSLYLADWTSEPSDQHQLIRVFLGVYGGAAAVGALLALARSFLFAIAGVRAAEVVHRRLVSAVLHTGFSFFSRNPCGRILNRFSSDVYTVDDSLPFILNILLAHSSGLIGILIVSMIGLPWIIALYVPLTVIYLYIQNYYRHTSRELKRLSTVSLSPLYSHFVETIEGLATIRALCDSDRMILEFMDRFDENQRVRLSSRAAVAWLNFRLQAMGVVMVTAIAVLGVAMRYFSVSVHSGIFGLAISYALSITGSLNAVVNAFTETEKELISVERLDQYMKLKPESGSSSTMDCSPSTTVSVPDLKQWPQYGSLVFRDVSLVYEVSGLEALSGVSFDISAGGSLGVVGRTGAGKSSLLAALLRLHRVSEGHVLVDGVDVSTVDVFTLRRSVSVLPQQSFVFSGTVRDNIDPSGIHSDARIWSAIYACHLRGVITSLSMHVDGAEGGQMLSTGQLQLLCLARVLVRGCRLLCLDEATANVDAHTDSLIQETLQSCLRSHSARERSEDDSVNRAESGAQLDAEGSTGGNLAGTGGNPAGIGDSSELLGVSSVLSISHRISAVVWCDSVVVLEKGRVVESGPPTLLLQQPSSAFYAMFQQQS